jgi:hypothetical protein
MAGPECIPVVVPGAGNLLIRVTGRTKPGKYVIGLECVVSKPRLIRHAPVYR